MYVDDELEFGFVFMIVLVILGEVRLFVFKYKEIKVCYV